MSTPDEGLRRRDRSATPPAAEPTVDAVGVAPSAGAASAPGAAAVAGEAIERTEAVSRPSDPHVAGSPQVAPTPPAAVEPPSPDVAPVGAESSLPGVHRGGFERWPTAPIGLEQTAGPIDAPEAAVLVQWAPAEPRAPYRGLAGWALACAIVALAVSTLVGWGFPIGLIAIITALVALRRPLESRGMATWALVLGVVSLFYSAGWLWYAASRADLFT